MLCPSLSAFHLFSFRIVWVCNVYGCSLIIQIVKCNNFLFSKYTIFIVHCTEKFWWTWKPFHSDHEQNKMKNKDTTNRYGEAKETIAIQFINGVFQWIQCYQNNRVQCFMSHTSQCETLENDEVEVERDEETKNKWTNIGKKLSTNTSDNIYWTRFLNLWDFVKYERELMRSDCLLVCQACI